MPHIELIARGALITESRVLLCRNIAGGYWYLPGGHVDFGESAEAAVRREFLEETGLEVVVGPPALAIEQAFEQGGRHHHELSVVFPVEHAGDLPPTEIQSLEPEIAFDWVDLAAVLDLDLRPLPIRAWLASGGRVGDGPPLAWLSGFDSDAG